MTPASQQALEGLRDLTTLKQTRSKIIAVASLYGIAIVANAVCLGFLGWTY